LQHLIGITRIKIDRAEQEKRWQKGTGRMMRDFAHLKEFYTVRALVHVLIVEELLCARWCQTLPLFKCSIDLTAANVFFLDNSKS